MPTSRHPQPRVAFVHAAARLHYALALALQHEGMLDRMYTEWFVTPGSGQERVSKLVRLVKRELGQRMLERRNPDIDPTKVVRRSTLPILTAQRLSQRRVDGSFDTLDQVMQKSARATLRDGFGDANVMMAFLRDNHPALFEGTRAMGLVTVGDQIIAPATIEYEELKRQFERFPKWQRAESIGHLPRLGEHERRAWAALDHVTCGSDYVKEGLVREGVEPERVSVLPYPLEAQNYPFIDRKAGGAGGRSASDPVTVGFVGHVHLRKGAPYFVDVAKRFRGRGIRFVMVGPVYVEPAMVAEHKDVVEVIGAVPRSQVPDWLRRFDMLLFPSTCEGCSSAVMEALSTGLPVIASPNSGTVIRDGTDGFVRAYDQIEAMAEAVEKLASNPGLRLEMGRAASQRAGEFSLDWYGRALGRVLTDLLAARPAARRATA